MAKNGTLAGAAATAKSQAAGARHGPSHKNVVHGGKAAAKPTSGGRTKPIKGSDRGGV